MTVMTATLVLIGDLLGTFVFALAGAAAAGQKRLALFGIIVLAFVTGNFGGITREVLLGAVPPNSIADWRYVVVSVAAGILTFRFYGLVKQLRSPVLIFDAAGLALFAVIGTEKALFYGLNPFSAALLGMLSGIGGGITRDLLLNRIPIVLRFELYAIAALAGSAVVAGGHHLQLPETIVAIAGAGVCFGLRLFAIRKNWELPTVRPPPA